MNAKVWDEAPTRMGPGALWYAGQGWQILPCWGVTNDGKCACGRPHPQPKDHGKHPHERLAPNGLKNATSDTARVSDWWREAPGSNVAVYCKGSGLLVIDADPRNDGLDSLEKLEQLLLSGDDGVGLPPTVTALTGAYRVGRGQVARGRHLFYRVPAGESLKGNLTREGLPGLDIKHDGYVLVAPSRHFSGEVYAWETGRAPWEIAVADAPEELLKALRKRGGGASAAGGGADLEWNGERIDVEALRNEGIGEGERNTTLLRVACSLANELGVETPRKEGALRSYMRDFNRTSVRPPLDDDELAKVVDNAIEQVKASPAVEKIAPWLNDYKEQLKGTGLLGGAGAGGAGGGASASGDTPLPPDPDALTAEEGGTPGFRTLTDVGNGRRLVDHYGERVRYSGGVGWFVWNGEYWVPDDGTLIGELGKKLAPLLSYQAAMLADTDPAASMETMKFALRTKNIGVIDAALRAARQDPRVVVPVSQWDADGHKLGVLNGVVDLRTGDLLRGTPEMHITRRSRVAYTPGLRNVRWEQFLEFATGGDRELQEWLQRAAGYTLTGDRTHDVLFLLYGLPGSGKSTFLEALGHMLGDYMMPLDASVMMDSGTGMSSGSDQYYWAQLVGKRMALVSELPDSRKTKEDAIKRLTGDMTITGRHPGERPFTFESQAKLWIGTNHRPIVSDSAMWRRIRAIPFERVPEKPDPELKSFLCDPEGGLPAALAWAVEGAVRLLGSGSRDALGWCAAVRDATAAYRKSEDRVGLFLEEETRVGPGYSVALSELFKVYARWSEGRGERPMTQIALLRKLQERGERLDGEGTHALVEGRALRPRSVAGGEWSSLTAGF